MKLSDASATFKFMSGHLVLHLGLLTAICVYQYSGLFTPYYCVLDHDKEYKGINWLVGSHVACVLYSIAYEISHHK
jgi:hypothetical protein